MAFQFSTVVIALVAFAGGTTDAMAQVSSDLTCRYTNPPGAVVESALPAGHHVRLVRSKDPSASEVACVAIVSDGRGAVVWTSSTGFDTTVYDGTGRDLDGDGKPDAVIEVNTGGGNRCCWTYSVLKFSPRFQVAAEFNFRPFYGSDATGHVLLFETVPFYDLGPDMASSPTFVRAHQFRAGRFQDVTLERCDDILTNTAHDPSTLQWEWELATPARRAASRTAKQLSFEVEQTRGAVTSLVLQQFVCRRPQDAARLAQETWPAGQADEHLEKLRALVAAASK